MKYRIEYYDEVISTNDLCMEAALKGEEEGLVIRANHQTGGRGQFGRKWISVCGKDLLFSVLLRPDMVANKIPILTHIAALAVKETIDDFIGRSICFIKKPNDVLIEGKKISGILTESKSRGQKVSYAVVGVGININSDDNELPEDAGSLKRYIGTVIDLEAVLKGFLEVFGKKYKEVCNA